MHSLLRELTYVSLSRVTKPVQDKQTNCNFLKIYLAFLLRALSWENFDVFIADFLSYKTLNVPLNCCISTIEFSKLILNNF